MVGFRLEKHQFSSGNRRDCQQLRRRGDHEFHILATGQRFDYIKKHVIWQIVVCLLLLFFYLMKGSPHIIIRTEEILIVSLVMMLWAGAIALFFNRWGKIRMLEPYQPKFQQNRSSCHVVDMEAIVPPTQPVHISLSLS